MIQWLFLQTVVLIVLSLTILVNLIFIFDANYKSRSSPTNQLLTSGKPIPLRSLLARRTIYIDTGFLYLNLDEDQVKMNRSDGPYLSLDIISSRSRVSVSVDGAEV